MRSKSLCPRISCADNLRRLVDASEVLVSPTAWGEGMDRRDMSSLRVYSLDNGGILNILSTEFSTLRRGLRAVTSTLVRWHVARSLLRKRLTDTPHGGGVGETAPPATARRENIGDNTPRIPPVVNGGTELGRVSAPSITTRRSFDLIWSKISKVDTGSGDLVRLESDSGRLTPACRRATARADDKISEEGMPASALPRAATRSTKTIPSWNICL
mmetsp:Transcript_30396/g.48776  ORF Transcript_30396/g.48776 Transcript_30396/m.48776 type:complete len:215 (+) Transcript_30396:2331-2975(+)